MSSMHIVRSECPRKESYASRLVSTLQDQRKDGFMCDFQIKVGVQSFPVHRNILAACSGYFRMMFENETKESMDGFISLKNVEAEAMKQCVNFMYSGEAAITKDNAWHVLYASGILQLNELAKLCFECLNSSIPAASENCSDTEALDQNSNLESGNSFCQTLRDISLKHVTVNLRQVQNSPLFPRITKDDLTSSIVRSDMEYQESWQAVIKWLEYDYTKATRYFSGIIKPVAEAKQYPFSFLLGSVWQDPMTHAARSCQETILSEMFSGPWESNINIDNCFMLLNVHRSCRIDRPVVVEEAVFSFMVDNFQEVTETKQFCTMAVADVCSLFAHLKHGPKLDEIKWTALVRYERVHSRKTFRKILKCVNIDNLSEEFIRSTSSDAEPSKKGKRQISDIAIQLKRGINNRPPTERSAMHKAAQASDQTSQESGKYVPPHLQDPQRLTGFGTFYASDPPASPDVEMSSMPPAFEFYTENIKNSALFPTPDGPNSYIVVADNLKREVNAWNMKKNSWHTLGGTGKGKCAGLVTIGEDLYALNGCDLLCFSKINTWETKATLHQEMDGWNKVVAFAGCIYIIAKDVVASYDPEKQSSIEYDKLPFTHGIGFCATATAEGIFVIGGMIQGDEGHKFNLQSRVWSVLPKMKEPRFDASATSIHDTVYVLGGVSQRKPLNTVESLPPGGAIWMDVRSMLKCRRGFSACVADGMLYVVGGDDQSSSIEVFNKEYGTWSIVKRLNGADLPCQACAYTAESRLFGI